MDNCRGERGEGDEHEGSEQGSFGEIENNKHDVDDVDLLMFEVSLRPAAENLTGDGIWRRLHPSYS
jgi:hypothetical protein